MRTVILGISSREKINKQLLGALKGRIIPTISMFYGILILMYFYYDKKHHSPHIHAEYGEYEASIAIDDGLILAGSFPPSKLKLVQA